jgi:preprotein translocase subunit YajC
MTWDTMTLVLAQDVSSERPSVPDGAGGPTVTSEVQDATGSTPLTDDGTAASPGPGSLLIWLLPLALVFLMLSMGNRKEKKKRAKIMAALSKGDKVQTVGGVLGTVVEVRDDEIVVKVDENANTRLRFARSAIQSILEPKNAN